MSLTESGAFRGSPQYASPEQVGLKGAPIDHRTDVFSLGATLYEAMTGIAPFRGETREQLFHAILLRDPVPPRKLVPELPRDLETVILAALEKDPARRYATAAALADDLERVRDGRPVSVRPLSPLGRLARWARRQPAKAALAATLVLGVPLVIALGSRSSRGTCPRSTKRRRRRARAISRRSSKTRSSSSAKATRGRRVRCSRRPCAWTPRPRSLAQASRWRCSSPIRCRRRSSSSTGRRPEAGTRCGTTTCAATRSV